MENSRFRDRRSFLAKAGQLSIAGAASLLSGSALAPRKLAAQTFEDEKTDETVAIATVNALEGAYGVHSGQRRNHAKGVGCTGAFVGALDLQRYSRSRLFTGEEFRVVARFSIAGGDPFVKDADRSTRGLAIEIRLPDGSLHHMTMLNTPIFFAKVPKTFLDKFIALKVDPATGRPDAGLLHQFYSTHKDTENQVNFLDANNPPRSYSEEAYFGIHTFFLVDKNDRRTKVKFHFEPRDGIHRMTAAEMASAPNDFLESALATRFSRGPAEWDMFFTIGRPEDEELDPTVPWPEDRQKIKAGTLKLQDALPSEQAGSFKINFDPLIMSDGIEASSDPVLLFRSPSYAVSHGRRLQNY